MAAASAATVYVLYRYIAAVRRQASRAQDEAFLAALGAGLPRCSGVALGFDRVVMIAAGARHIDEVMAFPAERA